ncbi:dipeptidyl aminopeptidase/acylaminoacyl peptidase [Catalinimonas alkaloidigena]|uniref:alpha/beta hydrolase family protein n=1 Tax=Catalinimonas alkaloidigena TaxID=1075417 RepID=UPI00240579EC|nr:S9 family peptidase [Catalinimonas alkaloidigena]MDF9797956.1 dipeptidyl aminopeptidase/acylaminoacyl peptidase [Catalinimonas alkaloidigena]
MIKRTILFCFVAVCLIHMSVLAQLAKPVFSSMDVFELEWVSSPQISPDGSMIVYERRGFDIMKDRKTSRLWLMSADGQTHYKLTEQDVNESNPSWSPDGSRIAFTSTTENGSEIYLYWLEHNRLARLTQLERSPSNLSWSPDGTQLAFSMLVPEKAPMLVSAPSRPKGAEWADHPRVTTRLKHESDGSGYIEPGYHHYFVIPAEGGTARQITQGNHMHRDEPVWTQEGDALIFSSNLNEEWEYDFRNSEIYKVSIADGEVTALTDRNGPDESPALSPDGEQILYVGFDDKVQTYQVSKVYVMDADGSNKREVPVELDRSISNPVWSADGRGFYFQYDDKGNTKIGFASLNGNMSEVTGNLGGTSIGRPYGGGSYSVSENGNIVFTHTTPYHPSELAMVKRGSEAALLTHLNQDLLDYRQLGEVEEIWYKSSVDDRDIQGWMVKPPSFDPSKKYPLLVENHGGPISNYGDRFSPEMQLLAADGYVVFYPNPRGSTSYGEEFGNLLYHNYPGDDYHDVMNGVDAMIEQGFIAEDSLFVTGGSAGGIMSAWIIGKNNRFRAAAVVKPVMNWISKTLTADNYYGYANSRFPGQPWENIETYMKLSPVSLVGNIETPTLVMVGTADLRTPLSEAKQLYHALKIRQVETALVEIPGSYHNISNRPSQLITKIDHILAWFDKYRE